ncbi:hypothetical protein MC885_005570 [Smutsia gigantea]|nr:hypothetical protein MC885_005570 [Smutsia gigantea]
MLTSAKKGWKAVVSWAQGYPSENESVNKGRQEEWYPLPIPRPLSQCLPQSALYEDEAAGPTETQGLRVSQMGAEPAWEKLQMTTSERRKIFCSVTFHVIAITCVVWSLYVLIDRTAEEIKQGNDNGVLEWPFWTKLVVVAIGFTGGLVFMYVQCKVYVQLWRRLKAYNRVIFVQNCPDTAKKQEKNFSCNVNTDIKDTVVVPVLQTGTNSLPPAEGSPPEVIPV